MSSGKTLAAEPNRRKAALIMIAGGYSNAVFMCVQGLVLVPLYLKFIGERLYGLYLASAGVVAVLGFLDVGLPSLIIQRVARAYARGDARGMGSYFRTGLLLHGLLMAGLLAMAAALSIWIPAIFHANAIEAPILQGCFVIAALASSCSLFNNSVVGFQQAVQRPLVAQIAALLGNGAGAVSTIVLLYGGFQLWSIPLGGLIRSATMLTLNCINSAIILRALGATGVVRAEVMAELLRVGVALLASKLGGSIVGQIEPALLGILFQPEIVTVYSVTKRMTGLIEYALASLLSAVFPGFSHLYAQGDQQKVTAVFKQLAVTVLAVGLVAYGTFMLINGSFVRLWVGEKLYGGQLLTTLVALASFGLVGFNFLGYLISATGDIAAPSLVIGAEAVVRLLVMASLLYLYGSLYGLPIAIVATTGLGSILLYRRLKSHVAIDPSGGFRYVLVAGLILGTAALMGGRLGFQSWSSLAGGATLTVLLIAGVMFITVKQLREYTLRPLRRA